MLEHFNSISPRSWVGGALAVLICVVFVATYSYEYIEAISTSLTLSEINRDYRLWDGKSILCPLDECNQTCDFKKAKTADVHYLMCLRMGEDMLSNSVRTYGRWDECDVLLYLMAAPSRSRSANNREKLYVDVGANIGACLIMMLSAGFQSVGFEPSKQNLFFLTSGLMANPPHIRKHLRLYNIGLGDTVATVQAHIAIGNAGNTILGGAIVPDISEQKFMVESDILVVPLDDVLWPDESSPQPHIKLMKLDAQGYEVKILRGAKRLLKAGAVGTIKVEVAPVWLKAANTSVDELFSILKEYQFVIQNITNSQFGRWDILASLQ